MKTQRKREPVAGYSTGVPGTHCKRGHEFTEASVYWSRGGKGRSCKTCARERPRVYKKRVRSPEEVERDKARNRAYYLANREKALAETKARYHANKPRYRAYSDQWRLRNPEKVRENSRKYLRTRLYKGIDYDAMFASQGGLCAICCNPETRRHQTSGTPMSLAIDHDHATGKIRGLLCGRCNKAIGLLRDSVKVVRGALEYMERHA